MIARYYILLVAVTLLSKLDVLAQEIAIFPIHKGSLTEANKKTVEFDLDFFVLVYDDTSNVGYKSLISLINDSLVVNTLQEKVLFLHESSSSTNGQALIKQFEVRELPAAFFVSKEGEKLRDINHRFEADQFLESYSRYVRRLP